MLVPILVVRLLECGEICSVCYTCLASVLVALPLCLENNSRVLFVVLVLVA